LGDALDGGGGFLDVAEELAQPGSEEAASVHGLVVVGHGRFAGKGH